MSAVSIAYCRTRGYNGRSILLRKVKKLGDTTSNSAFCALNPVTAFSFFAAVIVLSAVTMHPVFLCVSFIGALLFAAVLLRRKIAKTLLLLLPTMLLIALINPLFSGRGASVLLYINDRPVTKEAIAYGAASAMLLATLILWFSCYNKVMTSEKFIIVFGRAVPQISLIITMSMRLIPKLLLETREISGAQKLLGGSPNTGPPVNRIKNSSRILYTLTTSALENSVETADSMKARGYGAAKRSRFSLFRFRGRDVILLVLTIAFAALSVFFMAKGGAFHEYYRRMDFAFLKTSKTAHYVTTENAYFLPLLISYSLLCLMPFIIEVKEAFRLWRCLSQI